MDFQKEREAFESWFESRYDAHFMQFAIDLDMYVDKHTQTCWEAWQAAKAQAVPEVINVGNELQSWVAVWSFKARHDHEDYIVVDANLLADKIEKLTGANA